MSAGPARGQPINMNGAGQSPENLQQMKKRVEQELKSDKYKSSSNKGYVFTLMPLYAIGVGVFAAYKFLKVTTYTCSTSGLGLHLQFEPSHVCFCSRSGLQTTRPKTTSLQKGPKNPWRQVCVRICVCTFYLVSVMVSPSCMCACVCVCVHVCVRLCLLSCREPVERAGTKACTDREDAQFHPHPAGPADQLVSDLPSQVSPGVPHTALKHDSTRLQDGVELITCVHVEC